MIVKTVLLDKTLFCMFYGSDVWLLKASTETTLNWNYVAVFQKSLFKYKDIVADLNGEDKRQVT